MFQEEYNGMVFRTSDEYYCKTYTDEFINIYNVFVRVSNNLRLMSQQPYGWDISVQLPLSGGVDRKIIFQCKSRLALQAMLEAGEYTHRSQQPLRTYINDVCRYVSSKCQKGQRLQIVIHPNVGIVAFILGDGSKFLDNNVPCCAAA